MLVARMRFDRFDSPHQPQEVPKQHKASHLASVYAAILEGCSLFLFHIVPADEVFVCP
ncbi:protein of unknown function [Nitrospira defluvii]|uniref:Uncharacterized protein n=1 Tax=Nitrospira defluvii TaxID=330214 RepID=D8PFF3_9BACT|nr:protein of unknown function [Nitrospira defluvii]